MVPLVHTPRLCDQVERGTVDQVQGNGELIASHRECRQILGGAEDDSKCNDDDQCNLKELQLISMK